MNKTLESFNKQPINILVLGCLDIEICEKVFNYFSTNGGGLTFAAEETVINNLKSILSGENKIDLNFFDKLEFAETDDLVKVLQVSAFFSDRDDLIVLDIKNQKLLNKCLELIDTEKSKTFIV